MPLGILGRKIGMTQIFDEKGALIPVTVIEAGPCKILQKKTKEKEGYNAIQLGFGEKTKKSTNKPLMGHFEKAGSEPLQFVREFRQDNVDNFEVGQELSLDIFSEGEKIDVTGLSKGRGFQGVIRRHNQSRGPESHGSRYHRRPGSMGASAYPSRVMKGKKLPGRMGGARVTTLSLKIVKADKEKNLLLIKGCVPGHENSFLMLRKAVRNQSK